MEFTKIGAQVHLFEWIGKEVVGIGVFLLLDESAGMNRVAGLTNQQVLSAFFVEGSRWTLRECAFGRAAV
ncbi:hypothetical protein AB4Z50_06255 [Paenibacillus sp. 2TAB26]|uniref:hypothetical protein n=1 Tax=Paenibacillus sp. 2TAB26 TaxID=3233005 RepID=UPI003F975E44